MISSQSSSILGMLFVADLGQNRKKKKKGKSQNEQPPCQVIHATPWPTAACEKFNSVAF